MTDRFNDDHGYAGTRNDDLKLDREDLDRDPEDFRLDKGDDAFVLMYVKALTVYHRYTIWLLERPELLATMPASTFEQALETWLDRAQDQMPEWAQWLTVVTIKQQPSSGS